MLKKIFIFILVFSSLSCKKILEEKAFSSLTVSSFFNNYKEANQAVIGVYSQLPTPSYYKRNFTNVIGFLSDDAYNPGAAFTAFDDGTLEPTNNLVDGLWNSIFSLNGKAIFTISALENAEVLEAADKQLMLARVRFVRALNLYNAVRLWGDIPLVKEYSVQEENLYPARTPKSEVYAFIEEDLKYAMDILPADEDEYGFPTKGAAMSLLAKIYLSQEKWAEANTTLDQVIGMNKYALLDNYMDVFDVKNENNAEDIFSIQFKKDQQEAAENSAGSLLPFWFLPAFNGLGLAGNPDHPKGQMRVEHATYDRYTTGDYTTDERNEIFITSYPNSNNGNVVRRYPENKAAAAQGPACIKYQDPTNDQDRNYDNNLYILRYADVLLMKAEAENEVKGPNSTAYNAFNLVRQRSNAKPLATGLSKDAFRDAVSMERGLEFYGEFQSWFDQTRMKRSGDSYYKYYKTKVQSEGKFTHPSEARWAVYYPKLELMPIPSSELAINPNITVANQNPGY
ncbi:RagB/SusD family nutrient uptake outer membrane protein [Niabella insulamsoli]|uniref:RagB/SusD family nutrient uptake outer membrane protein n=1 Tax=Niabella insulamsoli TaxID=3144874 RepID=UPI0031FBEC98